MSSSLARAALTLLCAGAVLFGTALFPAALGVELGPDSAVDGGGSEPILPDDTFGDSEEQDAVPTESTSTPSPTPTATDEAPNTPATDQQGGGGLVTAIRSLFGVLMIGGLGYVAVVLLRSRDSDGYSMTSSNLSLGFLRAIPSVFRQPMTGVLQRIPQVTTVVLLSGSSALTQLATGIGTVSNGVIRGLGAGIGAFASISAGGITVFPRALGTLAAAPFQALGAFGGGGGLLASLRSGVARPTFLEPDEPPSEDARSVAEDATDDDDGLALESLSIRDAWAAMIELVPMSNPAARTPGEYARKAIDIGLPATPVRRLTELFREVEYGGESPTATRREAARSAFEEVRDGGDD